MFKKLGIFLLLLCSAVVAVASAKAISLLNLSIPTTGYSVTKDIAYGVDPRQRLDIYTPNIQDPKKTVLLFFYGGSWQWGSKNDYLFIGQTFAAQGYTTIIADYRLYPQVSFPAFIHDAADAFVWTHKNIATYGGNPDRIFIAGHSAGGYLALMLAANQDYLHAAGGKDDWIKGAIGLAGPYDFLPLTDPDIIALFSTASQATDTQPITFARPNMPPTLLLTGLDDETVYPKNSINLAAKMQDLQNDVTLRQYPDVNHYTIALSLAHRFYGYSPAVTDITQFINSH